MAVLRPEEYDATSHGLLRWIEDVTESCTEISKNKTIRTTHQFVPLAKINHYFADITKTKSLLVNTLGRDSTVDARTVATKCPRIFCILAELERENLIAEFVNHRTLWDDRLPFDPQSPPGGFPRPPTDPAFFNRFCAKQWKFSPYELDSRETISIDRETILPIVQKKWLAGGVTAELFHVVIHRGYDKMRDVEFANNADRSFAMKIYRKRNADFYFTTEARNFALLTLDSHEPTPGLIGFYGGFKHNGEYNILLEYADCGTLETYFETEEPPATGADILAFWNSFKEIIKAIVKIHEIKRDDKDQLGMQVFQGWHQDIKPKNILVLGKDVESPYERQFKLGDLGLSHFERCTSEDDPLQSDTRGSRTYGAPEVHRRSDFDIGVDIKATRMIDIWSLGCVMLEACIWVVRGKKFLDAFRTSRQVANDRLQTSSGESADDCFHDGRRPKPRVLQTVWEQIKQLQYDCRRSDFITEKLLDLVTRMLRAWPVERPSAAGVLADVENFISDADKELYKHNQNCRPRYSEATLVLRPTLSQGQDPSTSPPITPPQQPPRLYRESRDRGSLPYAESSSAAITRGSLYSSPQVTGVKDSPAIGHSLLRTVPDRGSTVPPPTASVLPPINRASSGRAHQPRSTLVGLGVDRGPSQPAPAIHTDLPVTLGNLTGTSGITRSPADAYSPGSLPGDSSMISENNDSTSQRPLPSGAPMPHALSVDERPVSAGPSNMPPSPKPPRRRVHAKKPVPNLSVEKVKLWKHDQKKLFAGFGHHKTQLSDSHLRQWLEGRDHIFLIDDSNSMRQYWDHVVDLIDPLAYLVKEGDPDGVELWFTNDPAHKTSAKSHEITESVKAHKGTDKTNIQSRLGEILYRYRKELQKLGKRARPASVYVLADGVWARNNDAKPAISETIEMLMKYGCERKQFGIQFISFGNDANGLSRLDELDIFGSELGLDIVDTESSRGNVWKMLIGAIDKTFDDESEDENDLERPATRRSNRE